ncbi:diaminopimelate decarboxylase [Helicobacter enhydrae]|uniref:Diaminopimelate decarboxylase n=1 Tax=Helicobacter enhydrae TaxID=222136 RepID=A0A1B1U4E1_9HELI|nr:diaminopimelate decarboxylase [Helicobacter enhydrae]ANV97575.1 diaminopimelate decarboxylase [Helicobacter enhydrae]
MQNIDFKHLAQRYQTPLYVYDFPKIQENFLAFKEAFAGRKSLICYALKANSNLSLIAHLAQMGAGADCVSFGEVRRALLAGIPKYKIIFSGVGKRDDEIEGALREDILFLNVESFGELKRIEKIAQALNLQARISVRVNPNIDAKTHPYISTGMAKNKFGVEIEEAKEMYLYIKHSNALEAVGIHFHIGSQICDLSPFIEASNKIAKLLTSLLALGLSIKFFDVGGGLGVCYDDENPIALYDYAQGILASLGGLEPTIICEPGRRIVAESGYFLTRVIGEKQNSHKRFVIVDGAMNDFLRPSLYEAYHRSTLLDSKSLDSSLCDIVGPICESGDYLAKDVLLPSTQEGDLIVFEGAGAYGYSMSSNYNTRTKPAEVALTENGIKLIRGRESLEDLFAKELECYESNKA